MKTLIFTLLLSVFFAGNICHAQKTDWKFSICNHSARQIPLSELKKFTTESCGRIIYTDTEGNELKITEYYFAMAPKKGGNAYFEIVKGDLITETIKEKIGNAKPGDMIVISQISCIKTNGATAMLSGKDFLVIE